MTDNLADSDLNALTDQQPQGRLNPLRLFWRHKWLVLLGVVVGMAIGAIYHARSTPIYQSSAQLLVVKKTPTALPISGTEAHGGATEDYLSTHQTLIRSPKIVGQAVKNANLGNLPS